MTDWDGYYLDLCRRAARKSKDPSTQVGAFIIRPDRTPLSFGYNGFPRGIADGVERLNDRDVKLRLTIHAELNAILNCAERPVGCTLYVWPMPPCHECARAIIQSGIAEVVTVREFSERWAESVDLAQMLFQEAGVRCRYAEPAE